MKATVLTLGCKVNQSESMCIESSFRNHGFSIVSLSEKPDYCIVNTCTVTAKSDYQSRQLIRRALRSGAKVIVTGCYAQLKSEEIRDFAPFVNIVTNNDKGNIINLIDNTYKSNCLSYSNRARAYVKVQDGCNNNCSYCIVPLARGSSRSTNTEEIVRNVERLAEKGYTEILLTGIHLGTYGYDLEPQSKISKLLVTILNKTNICRIRLSSLEVPEIDDELIELLGEERICRHMHIPLQSGDDRILNSMNRRYTAGDFTSVLERVTDKIPDISIGTDVIVGFPGEEEKAFLNTKTLLENCPVTYMHIFPFSPRPNTPASEMTKQVGNLEKHKRYTVLNELHIRKKTGYMRTQLQKTLDIVVEEQISGQVSVGTSSNYLKVKLVSGTYAHKSLVKARITGIEGNMLTGIPIETK